MITRLFGNKVEHVWHCDWNSKEVWENGEKRFVFTAKPELKCENKVVGHDEICNFEVCALTDDIYNRSHADYGVNISEDEEVRVKKVNFRADLGEMHWYCDKVTEEKETGKEEAERHYNKLIKRFNSTMIEQDEKLKAYCNLHHLKTEDTDLYDLVNIVYGKNTKVTVVDGNLKIIETSRFFEGLNISSAAISSNTTLTNNATLTTRTISY